jgi:outer membrane protein assembly factor BamB
MRTNRSLRLFAVMTVAALTVTTRGWSQNARAPQYHLIKKIVLGGEGGWDYFTVDPATHHIFIGRGDYVMVLDPDGKVIGNLDVGKTNEAHAVALAPDLHRAFTSNGDGSSVTIFDPENLKVISEVKISNRDTDDIEYDPGSRRIFTFNGGNGSDSTAIDAVKGIVVGKIPLGGKPETAQADGEGHIYVNIEDKSELREFDANTLQVMHSWPLAPCKNPSGQAINVAHLLLIIGCHNGLMEFWDYEKGKVVGTVAIGKGVDANRFDPGTLAWRLHPAEMARSLLRRKMRPINSLRCRPSRERCADNGARPRQSQSLYRQRRVRAVAPATAKHPHPLPEMTRNFHTDDLRPVVGRGISAAR